MDAQTCWKSQLNEYAQKRDLVVTYKTRLRMIADVTVDIQDEDGMVVYYGQEEFQAPSSKYAERLMARDVLANLSRTDPSDNV